MNRTITYILLSLCFSGCTDYLPSSLKQDFADLGNSNYDVGQRYKSYVGKADHCSFVADADYRVILAGFVPFQGRAANFSSVPEILLMTWNAQKLYESTVPILKSRLPRFSIQTNASESPGTYLCNNVSYVVLHGLSGVPLALAGNEIQVKVDGLSKTKAGFLHFPGDSMIDNLSVNVWTEVIASLIATQMQL